MKQKYFLIFGVVGLVITGIIFINGCSKQSPTLSTGITSKLSISNAPALNKTAELTLSVISPRTAPNGSAKIILPEGFELVDGDLTWQGVLKENEELQLKAIIKAIKVGKWTIFGGAPGEGDYLYISVSEDAAYISKEPFTNFTRDKKYAETG